MRRKIILFGAGCFSLLFILLVAFILLLPSLVNLEYVREKVETLLIQQLGGRVAYKKIDLFYFPQPGVKVHQVRISIPEKAEGSLTSIEVYPEFFAILRGRLQIKTIQVESPDFNIHLPEAPEKTRKESKPSIREQIEKTIGHVSSTFPNLKAILKDGRLNFLEESKSVLSFSHLDGYIVFLPDKAALDLHCRSNLWEKMSLKVTLDHLEAKGNGRLEVTNFYPHQLPTPLLASLPFRIIDGRLNLKINFKLEQKNVFQAQVEGSIPLLSFLQEKNKSVVIQAREFNSTLKIEEKRIQVVLTELKLDSPELRLAGRFEIDEKVPLFVLEVIGREMDVVSTRNVTLMLAGKIPVVNTIFDIVREGRVPLITFQSEGRTISDLDDMERFSIKGSIQDGKISIPIGKPGAGREDFFLVKAAGEVIISQGILEGRNLRGHWKNQQLQEGILRVGLEGKDAPFHFEITAETDLSLLPPLLSRVIQDKKLTEEIERFRQVEGRATGRVVLGESLKSIRARIDIQDLSLFARHDRIPYPITIDGGGGKFDGERLEVRNLRGKVGDTSFSQLTGHLGLEQEPYLEILSGKLAISIDEIYAWLSAQEFLRDDLKGMKVKRGTIRISELKLKGPVFRPKGWKFQAAGDVTALVVETPSVPGSITVNSGKFTADPERLYLSNVEANVLDASLSISGTLSTYLQGLEKAEVDLSGQITPKEIKWLSDLLQLKLRTHVRAPISISKAHLSWHKDRQTFFNGDLEVKEGPQLSLDISYDPHQLKVNRLFLRDEISQASMTLVLKERAISLTFSGQLSGKTLDKIFVGYPFEWGWLKGDFQAQFDLDQPIRSVVAGKIEGNHFSFPSLFGKPLEIEEASLYAKKNHFTVERAHFAWGGKRLALSGDVRFSEAKVILDIFLSTESLDLDELKDFRPKKNEEQGKEDELGLKLEGLIRFKSNFLKYERFIWKPFQANISLGQNGVEVHVEEGRLCGISTPGVVKMIDQQLSFDIQPVFRGRDFDQAVNCLLGHEIRGTGDWELKGRIFGIGKPGNLLHSLRGDLELQAKDGRISHAHGLSRILEFINVTEIYRGKLPDLEKEGLPYNLISVRGSLQNGRFIIKEAILDGTTLEMTAQGEIDLMNQKIDATLLVAPVKTLDHIIKLIPLVREIFAGTLVIIPARISGDLKDPKVTPLSPSAIGSELLAMMKRTLGLPFKVIEPFMLRKKEKNGEER